MGHDCESRRVLLSGVDVDGVEDDDRGVGRICRRRMGGRSTRQQPRPCRLNE